MLPRRRRAGGQLLISLSGTQAERVTCHFCSQLADQDYLWSVYTTTLSNSRGAEK